MIRSDTLAKTGETDPRRNGDEAEETRQAVVGKGVVVEHHCTSLQPERQLLSNQSSHHQHIQAKRRLASCIALRKATIRGAVVQESVSTHTNVFMVASSSAA